MLLSIFITFDTQYHAGSSAKQIATTSLKLKLPLQGPLSGSALSSSSERPSIYIPLTFASKTLTASGPLLGAPLGLGIERLPFCWPLGLPFKSKSWLGAEPCLLLRRRGVLGLLATNWFTNISIEKFVWFRRKGVWE